MPPLATAHRRALEALTSWPGGCPEATMIAQGFGHEILRALVDAGLATVKAARMVVVGESVEVALVYITEAGRAAL
jgi:hypothetical protein